MIELSKKRLNVSLIDIMHGVEKQAFLAFYIKANAVHGVMPLSIILMQLIDVSCTCLEMVVSITDKNIRPQWKHR
jgi:hypothetical protein